MTSCGTGYNEASRNPNPASGERNPVRSSPATREKRGLGFMNGSGAIGMPHRRPDGRTALRAVSFLCLWCLLPAWSASGAYKNLAVKVGPVEGYASRQSQGPVTIATDPYLSETRIRTVFDIKGLSKLGLVPINLIISNQGSDALSIDVESITLLDPEYGSLQVLSPREAVHLILRQDRRRRGNLSPVPLPRSPRPPFVRGRSRVEKHFFEIKDDIIRKSLKRRIRPRATAWGFVFFQLPESRRLSDFRTMSRLASYKIIISDVENNRTQQKLLYFDIELK